LICALIVSGAAPRDDHSRSGEGFGVIRISAAQDDALLYVDGRFLGCLGSAGTSMDVTLPVGDRQLRVAVPWHPDVVRTVKVDLDTLVTLRAASPRWLEPGSWSIEDRPIQAGPGQVVRASMAAKQVVVSVDARPGDALRIMLCQRRFAVDLRAHGEDGTEVPVTSLPSEVELHAAAAAWGVVQPKSGKLILTIESRYTAGPNGIVLAIHRAPPPPIPGAKRRLPATEWSPKK